MLGNGILMFDARKRVCEWIFLDSRNRRVLMLGNGLIIDMGLIGMSMRYTKTGLKAVGKFLK